MTRLVESPVPIRVLLVDGAPAHLTWGGYGLRVDHIALHWRVRVWWRGIWRAYYKLAAQGEHGIVLLVIYHDLMTDRWYLQEVFD